MTDEAANIVPFGKYRGQPVEAMMADQNYCAWALTQPGLRAKFPSLIAVIVNGGTAPDAPTPEHNRMQLLFRNPDMRVSTYRSIIGEELDGAIASWLGKSDPVVAAGDAAALAAVDEEMRKVRSILSFFGGEAVFRTTMGNYYRISSTTCFMIGAMAQTAMQGKPQRLALRPPTNPRRNASCKR
jgi:hypothetical protein